jgi:hypothetical protein
LCIRQEAYLCKPHGLFLPYNDRPTWLQDARARLDRAAFAAYGWPEDISDEDILKALPAPILERSSPAPLHGG